MNPKTFNQFWLEHEKYVVELIASMIPDIQDAYIDEPGGTPCIQLTISVNEECTEWSYQTGDNSYSGSCYGHPYWGVNWVTRDCDPKSLAKEIIDDLASVIEFTDEEIAA